ncbi:uncharacterized protein LOC109802149 [Cajanus cajan]|uniref:Uncharacterized protein n=1 Tax=Cajanus cajan TaxID=3821 RepID=A0A151TD47_CAJCA|nr:uncharacterized protein LOC109802149 [Cajanus cajan]KYP64990.1 hypothetical protein KK1_019604 [Cajanus cajan]
MALSFSHHPLLHGNKTHFAPSSKPNNTYTHVLQFSSVRCFSTLNNKGSINLKTCKNCKTQFDPALNHPLACRFHTAHFGGETKRKFESVYEGGTMNTPDAGKVFQYWHCCGSEDPFDPGCTASPHTSYDD